MPAAGHVPTPRPPDQCSRRQNTSCAGASNTVTDTGEGLCSTDQAPESLNLCCHSLPSDGVDRPFRARTPAPFLRLTVSPRFRSGMGAWADRCREMGWDGVFYSICKRFTMCCLTACGGGPPKHARRSTNRVSPNSPGPGEAHRTRALCSFWIGGVYVLGPCANLSVHGKLRHGAGRVT